MQWKTKATKKKGKKLLNPIKCCIYAPLSDQFYNKSLFPVFSWDVITFYFHKVTFHTDIEILNYKSTNFITVFNRS